MGELLNTGSYGNQIPVSGQLSTDEVNPMSFDDHLDLVTSNFAILVFSRLFTLFTGIEVDGFGRISHARLPPSEGFGIELFLLARKLCRKEQRQRRRGGVNDTLHLDDVMDIAQNAAKQLMYKYTRDPKAKEEILPSIILSALSLKIQLGKTPLDSRVKSSEGAPYFQSPREIPRKGGGKFQ
jgi:hypothetical protein